MPRHRPSFPVSGSSAWTAAFTATCISTAGRHRAWRRPSPGNRRDALSLLDEGSRGWSADRALARRDGGKHRPDNGELDCGGTAVPDTSLADVEASKLAAVGVEDIGTHHIQGDVPLLACPGNLGDAVTAVGRHPVSHGLAGEFAKIADMARSAGGIHHRFGVGDGFVVMVNEWETAGHFQQFFSDPDLQAFIGSVGAAPAPPEITITEAVASPDQY